jgi:hypothetical protein
MRLQPAALVLAALVLAAAPAARAIPNCDEFPDLPICNPDPDPDPCEIDPASCEPDPCELDPASCEPDPCEADPASCEPDPCASDPASCEPEPEPEPEPVDYTHSADFEGSYLVKGEGKKTRFAEQKPEVLFDEDHFLLIFDKTQAYAGSLVPKGKKGTKFEMLFDSGASADGFAQFVAEQMGFVAGRPPQTAVGQSTKMVFVLRADQTALLKIKSSVVESDGDEIVFKLKMTGVVAPLVEG